MIHEIGIELQARLRTQGVPLSVIDGPEPSTTTWGRERIVIEHDDGSDSFGPPRLTHINPKHRRTRSASYRLTIYSQSTVSGPNVFEHKRRCEHILDQVLIAMDYVAAARKNKWEPKNGRFITPTDLEKTERPAGAVYELSFTFDRAVFVRTWANAIQPEHTIGAGGVTSLTKVSQSGTADDDDDPSTVPASAETACGA